MRVLKSKCLWAGQRAWLPPFLSLKSCSQWVGVLIKRREEGSLLTQSTWSVVETQQCVTPEPGM